VSHLAKGTLPYQVFYWKMLSIDEFASDNSFQYILFVFTDECTDEGLLQIGADQHFISDKGFYI